MITITFITEYINQVSFFNDITETKKSTNDIFSQQDISHPHVQTFILCIAFSKLKFRLLIRWSKKSRYSPKKEKFAIIM